MVGESVIFNALVEKSALRRRASRLLAIAGAPRRKTRELVLTDRRLVCLKHKPGRPFQLSNELALKGAEHKDAKHVVLGVEPKGEREFVVLTVRDTRACGGWPGVDSLSAARARSRIPTSHRVRR